MEPIPATLPGSAPKQARAVATRARILASAATEFAAEGYQSAALSKILERSGVTKGALYFHFESKEAMALAVYEEMQRRYPRILAQFRGHYPDALTETVHLAVGLADVLADDDFCRGGIRVATEGALGAERTRWPYVFWDDAFTDLLARASDEGTLRDDVGVLALARTVVALGIGHRAISTATTGLADLRERAAASWEILIDRIATPEWLAAWRAAGGMASVPDGITGPGPEAGVPDGVLGPVP